MKAKKVLDAIVNFVEGSKAPESGKDFDSRISEIHQILDTAENAPEKEEKPKINQPKKIASQPGAPAPQKASKKEYHENPKDLQAISNKRFESESKLSELSNKISDIENAVNPGKMAELESEINVIKVAQDKLTEAMMSIANMKRGSTPVAVPDNGRINSIEKSLKEISARIPEIAGKLTAFESEINSLKSVKPKSDNNILESRISGLSGKISDISREMSLDRAMYPKNILDIQKELIGIKLTQKSMAELMDTIAAAKKDISVPAQYQSKIQSLEKSIQDISKKIPAPNNSGNPTKEISEISKKIADIEREMNLDRAMYPKNIADLQKGIANIKSTQKELAEAVMSIVASKKGGASLAPADKGNIDAIASSLKQLSSKVSELDSIKSRLKTIDSDISAFKALQKGASQIAPPASNEMASQISEIKREIENLRAVDKKIAQTVELDSKTIRNLKGAHEELSENKKNIPDISEFSKKVADIEREMNLDRIMYPKNILDIQKELISLKSAQKSITEIMDSVIKSKIGSNNAQYQNKMLSLEKSVRELSKKVSEPNDSGSSLKEIPAIKRDIDSLKKALWEINAGSKSSADSKKEDEIESKVDKLSEQVLKIGNAEDSKRIESLEKEALALKDTQKNMADLMESLAENYSKISGAPAAGKIPEIYSLKEKQASFEKEIELLKKELNAKSFPIAKPQNSKMPEIKNISGEDNESANRILENFLSGSIRKKNSRIAAKAPDAEAVASRIPVTPSVENPDVVKIDRIVARLDAVRRKIDD